MSLASEIPNKMFKLFVFCGYTLQYTTCTRACTKQGFTDVFSLQLYKFSESGISIKPTWWKNRAPKVIAENFAFVRNTIRKISPKSKFKY